MKPNYFSIVAEKVLSLRSLVVAFALFLGISNAQNGFAQNLTVKTGPVKHISCNGSATGAISLSVSGGIAPYTYNWSNGATPVYISALPAGAYSVTVIDSKQNSASLTVTLTEPAAITASFSTASATCSNNNGSAKVFASGGVPPYTYKWDKGDTTSTLNKLGTGYYYITITDAHGCSYNTYTYVNQVGSWNISLTALNASCSGTSDGEVYVSAISGGTQPYSYLWSTGATGTDKITGLKAGNYYYVTVTDASGCSNSNYAYVYSSNYLGVGISSMPAGCSGNDGISYVKAINGVPPYTYSWSDGVNILSTNDSLKNTSNNTYYYVNITDSKGCSASTSIYTYPNNISAYAYGINTSCAGNDGVAYVSVSGGVPPYKYLWIAGNTTDTIKGLAGGQIYYVTATDSKGCMYAANTYVGSNSFYFSLNTSQPACNASNGKIWAYSFNNGNLPYSYNWSTGATTDTISNLAPNTYSVTITDAKGCSYSYSIYLYASSTYLSLSFNSTSASCNGNDGTASVNQVYYGIAPFSYVWNTGDTTPSINGLTGNAYYYVTVTDAKGCSGNNSTYVNKNSLSFNTGYMGSSCANSDGVAYLYNVSGSIPYTYLWNTGATTDTIKGLSTSTYYYVTVTDVKGCSANGNTYLYNNSNLSVTLGATPASCKNNDGSAYITSVNGAPPYTYQWSTGATTAIANGLTGNTYYYLTITDSKGCNGNASVYVSQDNVSGLSVNAKNTSCVNSSDGVAYITKPIGGNPPYSIKWSTGATKDTIMGLASNHTYYVNITDSKGCSAVKNVTIYAPYFSAGVYVTNATCKNTDGMAYVYVSGGVAPFYYKWNNGATTDTINKLVAGNYSVTVTDSKGCMVTAGSSLYAGGSNMYPYLSSLNISCQANDGVAYVSNISGGVGPYYYKWNNGGSADTIAGLSTSTYYAVIVSDSRGCTASNSVYVGSGNLYIYAYSQSASCANNDGVAYVSSISYGVGPYKYKWNTGATTDTIKGISGGTYYYVTITDSKGCMATADTYVYQNSIYAGLYSTAASCGGAADGMAYVYYVSGGVGPYSYKWSTGATTDTIKGISGNAYYYVTVIDSKGCTTNNSVYVYQNSIYAYLSYTDPTSCAAADGKAYISYTSGGVGPYSYKWSTGATTDTIKGLNGNAYYYVTITDSKGCMATNYTYLYQSSFNVYVNSYDASCANGNGSAKASPSGGTGPYKYLWNTGATTDSIANLYGNQYYYVTVTDSKGCSAEASVYVYQFSFYAYIAYQPTTCAGNDGMAYVSYVSGGVGPYKYRWSTGAKTDTIRNLASGKNYYVTITDSKGCLVVDSVYFSNSQYVYAYLASDSATCSNNNGKAHVAYVYYGTAPYSYKWSTGATTDNISGLSGNTSYYVTVTDSKGCKGTASVFVNQYSFYVALNSNPSKCDDTGGKAYVSSVTGGVAPYSYKWNTGANTDSVKNVKSGKYTVTVTDNMGCSQIQWVYVYKKSIALVTSTKLESCIGHDGKAWVQLVYGGVSPYIYKWSAIATADTIRNLTAGKYHVTVTDSKGCSADSLVIVAKKKLIPYIYATNVSCKGGDGSAQVTVSGGSGIYTYHWSNGASGSFIDNLAVGTYYVTVADNQSCMARDSVVIQSVKLSVSLFVNDVSCGGYSDGYIYAYGKGGVYPYTFSWSNGATTSDIYKLVKGKYSVTITDSKGCTAMDTATVKVLTYLIVKVSAVCQGDSGVLLTSSTGDHYNWSTGATTASIFVTTKGIYSITVSNNNGCGGMVADTIVNPNPDKPIIIHIGNTLHVHAAGSDTMQWFIDNTLIPGQKDTVLTVKQAGYYKVIVKNKYGCVTNMSDTLYASPVGIEELQFGVVNEVKLYPNPFAEQLTLSYMLTKAENISISIYDITGRQVALLIGNERQNAGRHQVQMESSNYNLSQGMYLVRLKVGDAVVMRRVNYIK